MIDLEASLRTQLADRYTVHEQLGRGGMSLVYRAEDRKHRRQVAIKVLRPELAAIVGADRFLQEIEVAARLQHPHILPLYDSGQTRDPPFLYYVMPFVPGASLRERLRREKQLSIEDAVMVAREVADGLEFAHEHGVVHRDIKPENILFQGGHAVIADFGIARALDVAGGTRLTGTGIALGTPAYMSPEQATAAGELDGRTDVYALGAVLYEMLAGVPPFEAATPGLALARRLTEEAPAVTHLRPSVPASLAAVVRRALATTPADRHPSARRFAEALREVGGPAAMAAPTALPSLEAVAPPVAVTAAPPRARRTLRPRWLAVGALGAAVVTAVLLSGPPGTTRGSVTPSAEAIAVLPMVPVSHDTSLARLGRELAVTVGANLDGIGTIRIVDPLTVLARVDPAGPVPADAAAALARELGARALLHGTLVRVGADVRLDAQLSAADGLAPLARATVTAPADDLLHLSDSLTFAILSQVWRRGEVPAPSLAAITTHSIEALRAYLEGERALARADFPLAVDAFERAFAADSTFWFAYWRSLYPRVYELSEPDSATLAAVFAHRAELPPADRLLVESQLQGSLSDRLTMLRRATRQFPTYWPAWYTLANTLVHAAPMLGSTFDDARDALERVVSLNPSFVTAVDHLFWYGVLLRDTALGNRTFAALERLAEESPRMTENRTRYYGAMLRVVRSGGRPAPGDLEADADFLVGLTAIPATTLGYGLLDFRLPRAQIHLNDLVLARHPSREKTAAMWLGNALSWATRGAWTEALDAVRQWLRATNDPEAPLAAYGLAVVGAHLGSVEPQAASEFRPRIAESNTADARAEHAWLDGVAAHASRDPAALAAARRALAASGGAHRDLLARSLDAVALDLSGDRTGAARRLAALEVESAESGRYHDYARPHPFLTSVHRLFAARGLVAAGDTAQASRLLTWTDAILWNAHGLMDPVLAVFEPLAAYERARIAAASGDSASATELYARFLQRYDRPEGAWRVRVEEALGAVNR